LDLIVTYVFPQQQQQQRQGGSVFDFVQYIEHFASGATRGNLLPHEFSGAR